MLNRSGVWAVCLALTILFADGWSSLTMAGPLVFGPQIYTRGTASPQRSTTPFTIPDPRGTFWLQVSTGELIGGRVQRVVSSAVILLNGVQVAGPADFNQNVFGFQKDVTLQAGNTLEVEVRGAPGSFIEVEIRKAEPNRHVSNRAGDLDGLNMGDQIALWWDRAERAAEYIFFRADTIDGPWVERFRMDAQTAGASGADVDITPDARLMDLCYKVHALDAKGTVIRRYDPICVPKFVAP